MQRRKDFLSQLFHRGRNITDFLTFNRAKAVKWQEKTLKKIIFKARKTEFGKAHNFENILISGNTSKTFADLVPISNYELMHPYWMREFQGESDITWPGRPKYFALSSGTSEGSSKYIPVTQDQLKSIVRASRRQLFAIAKTDVPKDFLAKNYLMIGGSTDLNFNGISFSGDLSGITTANVPIWFERFSLPGGDIQKLRDWDARIEKMIEAAPSWDVVLIAGGPAWIKILLEKIIERYQLKNIHELWPNFSIYTWGAVALMPYKKQIDSLLGKPILYFETYLASEGFIAFQTRQESEGMRLVLRNNIYYEFVEFNDKNFESSGDIKPDAVAINLANVEEGKDYALLITTAAGAWRYLIGDTVRFTDVDACEIKITGRTKQFLSICGEHLSVENMTDGVLNTAEELGINIPEFTVKGIVDNGIYGHEWYLACNEKHPSAETVKEVLDKHLGLLNDDYLVERKHILTEMKVNIIPESVFLDWMDNHGKLGGQSKFPRVLSDKLYKDWCEFVKQYKSVAN